MKRHSKFIFSAVTLLAASTAVAGGNASFEFGQGFEVAQTQAPLQLTCAISVPGGPALQFSSTCTPPYASSNYTVVFKVSGGSGSQSYVWQAPTPNNCTSTTSSCTFSTTARRSDVEGNAYVTVTDLGTGAVTPLSTYYAIPITCYNSAFGYYYC